VKQKFLSGVTLAALTLLVALPLLFILLQAIFPHFSAGSLHDAFGGVAPLLADPQLPSMLGGTLWIAGGVALASVMIGLPLGILRGMFSLPLPRLWDLLFLIPFLTPPYISALSWMLALQSQGYLQQLTGWQLNDLLFSRSGIVLVMTFNIFPVVYFAVSRSLLASGQRLAMVARVHGASAWRAFWHVTLPMLSPALASGMLLAFTLAIEEFGVPAALGSRAGVVMLTVGIEKKLADWPVDLTGAALLSLLLMAVALFAWWLQTRLVGEKEVTSVTGKPGENRGASLGWMTLPALLVMAAVGGLADAVQQARAVLHGADELAADRHQAGRHRALQVFGRAHVDQAGGDGAGREAMLHQGHQHRVDDAHVHRPRLAAQDLHDHDFGEGLLADQVFHQVDVAVRHAGEVMGAEAGFGRVHGDSLRAASRTAFLSTLPTGERGRLAWRWICLGVATGPSRPRTWALSASASAATPGCSCTAAWTASPHLSSGRPNTEHS